MCVGDSDIKEQRGEIFPKQESLCGTSKTYCGFCIRDLQNPGIRMSFEGQRLPDGAQCRKCTCSILHRWLLPECSR